MFKRILSLMVTGSIVLSGMVSLAAAQENYSIKEMTTKVEQALDGRRNRYDELSVLKASGIIGENNQGYVEVLKEGKEVQSLVDAENQDRRVIYQTIAEQNDLMDARKTIEKVFAQVQRDKAQSGI